MDRPVPAPTLLRRRLARRGLHTPRTHRARVLGVVAIVALAVLLGGED